MRPKTFECWNWEKLRLAWRGWGRDKPGRSSRPISLRRPGDSIIDSAPGDRHKRHGSGGGVVREHDIRNRGDICTEWRKSSEVLRTLDYISQAGIGGVAKAKSSCG